MKKWLLALVILLATWFILKDWAYITAMTHGPAVLTPPLTYTETDDWIGYPDDPPAGAWETPWGIDAFVILPPAGIPHKHGLIAPDNEAALAGQKQALATLLEAIPSTTPVYAPNYRSPSPANKGEVARQMTLLAEADLLAAFEAYIETANQGRGIVLIIAEPAGTYSNAVLSSLQNEALVNRFAGLVRIVRNEQASPSIQLNCAGNLNGICHHDIQAQSVGNLARIFLPRLHGATSPLLIVDPAGTAEAIRLQVGEVSEWLDETQPKPAEPFFDLHVIKDSPIYRPDADTPINEPTD